MNSNIFLPKTITVGYQNRSGTYTQKLGYIIYTDDKGVLRKEKSWEDWRDKEIQATMHNNEPTEGFVLNKKVGGDRYSYNPRQTYTRVYDPRGFEFEITIPNLLYILENCSAIKGKGLEGKFVYGWQGTELLLIPCEAPEYQQMQKFSALQAKKITSKDLVQGCQYYTKKNQVATYLGRFDAHLTRAELRWKKPKGSPKKKYFFWIDNGGLEICEGLTKIATKISDEQDPEFATKYEKMECREEFSPVDHYELIPLSLEGDFIRKVDRVFIKGDTELLGFRIYSERRYDGVKSEETGLFYIRTSYCAPFDDPTGYSQNLSLRTAEKELGICCDDTYYSREQLADFNFLTYKTILKNGKEQQR